MMTLPASASIAASLCLSLLLSSCGSTKPERSDTGPKLSERLRNWDMNQKSPFEKAFTALGNKKDQGDIIGSQSFRTSDYGGNKSFAGMKSFKTSEFSQGRQGNRFGSQNSRYATQGNRNADATFATNDSALGSMPNAQGNKVFRDMNQAFGTSSYREGTKSIEKNQRPVIIEGDIQPEAKIEFDAEAIRKMVNR